MKMNRTAEYGLTAAGYMAEHADEGWVRANTIAEEYGIPMFYLIKIMQQMIKANILRSKRGPGGGFALARPAKEITLLEIIEAAGGPISTQLELAQLAKKAQFSVEMENVCKKASEKAASILSRAKLSKMVSK
jgi:Rrf2 family protein